jgi:hypothetical protein
LRDLNASASSFRKFDAFQPFQAKTAFTDDQTHNAAVRHHFEIPLRSVEVDAWNGKLSGMRGVAAGISSYDFVVVSCRSLCDG